MTFAGAILPRVCRDCGKAADRFVPVDRPPAPCDQCGGPMLAPDPGIKNVIHGGFVCFGPSHQFKHDMTIKGREFGGPRERDRYLKEQGMTEFGTASITEVERYFSDLDKEKERKEDEFCEQAADQVVTELARGGGLYRTEPAPSRPAPEPPANLSADNPGWAPFPGSQDG